MSPGRPLVTCPAINKHATCSSRCSDPTKCKKHGTRRWRYGFEIMPHLMSRTYCYSGGSWDGRCWRCMDWTSHTVFIVILLMFFFLYLSTLYHKADRICDTYGYCIYVDHLQPLTLRKTHTLPHAPKIQRRLACRCFFVLHREVLMSSNVSGEKTREKKRKKERKINKDTVIGCYYCNTVQLFNTLFATLSLFSCTSWVSWVTFLCVTCLL